MEIENTFIEGLMILHLKKMGDNRGSFIKIYNEDFYKQTNLRTDFKESYFSVSHKNVIRGMHFQIPPAEHVKLVFVNKGSIVDVVLDIRKESKTFRQFFFTIINDDSPKLVYIPVGCAHGFLSLQDNTIVSYIQTSTYNADCDKGILYNSFGMDWETDDPVISGRDLLFPKLANFDSPL